ncbi:MAG: tetratricopeptide repeat protein [Deltaproteobacteria bacterium]|jgi:tetratricopeptide (TPR) repeat protein|nr:tetratricopeptide repeat protein [Deltaproteobacteria bacterium]
MALKVPWQLRFNPPGDPRDLPGWEEIEREDFAGAETVARRALKDRVRAHGSSCGEALPCLDVLGAALLMANRAEEAEPVVREAVAISSRSAGPLDGYTYDRMLALGVACLNLGRVAEALSLLGTVAEARKKGLGPEHPATLNARAIVAVALVEEGRADEASAAFAEVLDAFGKVPPNLTREPYLSAVRHNAALAESLRSGGAGLPDGGGGLPGAGEQRFGFRLEDAEARGGLRDPAREMRGRGDLAEAEKAARTALARCPAPGAPGREEALAFLDSLGLTLSVAGRNAEAVPCLEEAVSLSLVSPGPGHALTLARRANLGIALSLTGRPGEGLGHLASLMDYRVARLAPGDPLRLGARSNYGIALALDGRADMAEPILREVLDETGRIVPPDMDAMQLARKNLEMAQAVHDGLLRPLPPEP